MRLQVLRYCLVLALLVWTARGETVTTRDSASGETTIQRDHDRQLGARGDIATEVINLVVNKAVGDMIEADEIRRVYYRRAKRQLGFTNAMSEEDAELEEMKRQKEDQEKYDGKRY